jgi:hypothetical protein
MSFERRFVKLAVRASDLVMVNGTDPDAIVEHLLSQAIPTDLCEQDFMDRAEHFYRAFPVFVKDALREWQCSPLCETHPQSEDVIQGIYDYLALQKQFSSPTIHMLLKDAWSASQCARPESSARYIVRIVLPRAAPGVVRQTADRSVIEVEICPAGFD